MGTSRLPMLSKWSSIRKRAKKLWKFWSPLPKKDPELPETVHRDPSPQYTPNRETHDNGSSYDQGTIFSPNAFAGQTKLTRTVIAATGMTSITLSHNQDESMSVVRPATPDSESSVETPTGTVRRLAFSNDSASASDTTVRPRLSSPTASDDGNDEVSADADNDDDQDAASSGCQSTTSTIQFNQEPFAEIVARATQLVYHKLWPVKPEHFITAEKLPTGGFNRAIKFSLQCRKPLALGNYSPQFSPSLKDAAWVEPAPEWYAKREIDTIAECVLRVPRNPATPNDLPKPRPHWQDGQYVQRDAAIIRFVRRQTSIPVPKILLLDKTRKNILGYPYMVQEFMRGQRLEFAYQYLGHEARCRLAQELGAVYREMLSVRSKEPGRVVSARTYNLRNREFFRVTPLHPTQPLKTTRYSKTTPPKSVKDTLLHTIDALQNMGVREDGFDPFGEDWDQLRTVVNEMDEYGLFSGVHFALAHGDLAPHNILVNTDEDPSEPTISAVIDWDNGLLTPSFMACEPPFWLWGWQEGVWNHTEWEGEADMTDERISEIIEPATAEGVMLKDLFEAAAGPDFRRFAYSPEYRLARKLVFTAREGFWTCMPRIYKDEIVERWPIIRSSLTRPSSSHSQTH
ncbi:hypothetical protein F5Y18DRAFT_377229 [Xylariaceae sp. FL1019]|nr:hypothetical protein F5Y18DRAFT_377229 [Xylariaceae sp. FL1019]